jgi:murein L,D-transpeptidase YcbB/YkuD
MSKSRMNACLALASLAFSAAPGAHASGWSADQVRQLRQFIASAPEDGLPVLNTSELDAGLRDGPGPALDATADTLALALARLHLLGMSTAKQKASWQIADADEQTDVREMLHRSLAEDALARFFIEMRPAHPDYAALRAAYATETDRVRRAVIARNMERWRWMPRSLGENYVLVNAAFFEARLAVAGRPERTWRVIVGKASTPTPVFAAQITGITLNPWWNIPASIVREKGGRFAANQGYVMSNGQWRQKPGPGNALGQMKLVMPNPYSIYVHDTPSRQLFAKETRAFSHGCVRIADALGFAAALLEGSKTASEIAATVRSAKTVTFDLASAMPIYLAYFTAAPGADGTIAFQPDIYRRDSQVGIAATTDRDCKG